MYLSNSDLPDYFWANLMRRLIEESGKSVHELADETGIAPTTLYNWMSGITRHPRIDKMERVAAMCGYNLRELLLSHFGMSEADTQKRAVNRQIVRTHHGRSYR